VELVFAYALIMGTLNRCLATIGVTALTLWSTQVSADEQLDKINRVASMCINFVRTLPQRYRDEYATFDAYYDGKGFQRYGTPAGDFQFGKCMAQQGTPLAPPQ
jgi:hypothetical protein